MSKCHAKHSQVLFLIALLTNVLFPVPAHAYIGPGAGFAFLGSAFVLLLTIAMGFVTVFLGPIIWTINRLRGRGIPKKARARRIVIIGLDGLDPNLAERFIAEGQLPHLAALSKRGSYRRLQTTLTALSPVAWATFQTGVNPGAHNIFDFLTRDKRFCLPELSSTKTTVEQATLKFGPFKWTRAKASVKLLRKSRPFWKVLSDHGIFSNILRVPISYPPEKFKGNILSAMCTPDLRGTQGSFTLFSTKEVEGAVTGGWFYPLRDLPSDDGRRVLEGVIQGPPSPNSENGGALEIPFIVGIASDKKSAELRIDEQKVLLTLNEFSEWVELTFSLGRRKVSGIARFCLRRADGDIALYMSPINANPVRPVLPISHPIIFSQWLAKHTGLFGTLGLMEDTWGRNEMALDDRRFLDQAYGTHQERERMLFETLDRTREGLCVCVFDATDRIQHMFWRYLDEAHPSPREGGEFDDTIGDLYRRMDNLIERVEAKLSKDDLLLVLSDHGFSSFRRGINLNSWLRDQGYLVLKNNARTSADYFADIDWEKTRAFAVGLTGLYINKKGRERLGIVEEKDALRLKQDIAKGLEALLDPKDGARSINRVYDSTQEYRGLYVSEAPDLIVGYSPGYRVSWDSVTGGVEEEVFSDNIKAWSGDHHIDPPMVPGVLFSNQPLKESEPHIRDIAPTVLSMFAVPVPQYMEGKSLM